MIIINGTEPQIDVDPMDASTWPKEWFTQQKLYDGVGGFVLINPDDKFSVINGIIRLIGRPPVPPEVAPGTSLVPVQVPGPPGMPWIPTLTSLVVDPSVGAALTAEQNEYNQAVEVYKARLAFFSEQYKTLLSHTQPEEELIPDRPRNVRP
jgi:hypothetical protein